MNSKTTLLFLAIFILSIGSCVTHDSKKDKQFTNTNITMHSIINRKSVRAYTQQEIPKAAINDLLKAAMAAPSSRDRRPWEFVVISDSELLNYLGTELKTASCLKDANKAIAVCGNIETSDNCWFLDCSAATQNILLAAESMGLGAVWTAVYPYEDRSAIVEKALSLPSNIKPLAIIPLGYPQGKHSPKDKFDESRIHYNNWKSKEE